MNTSRMYEIWLESSAERDLKQLSKIDFERIIESIRLLSQNPRPAGSRKISGSDYAWRIRVGAYRVIYKIDDRKKSVLIFRVRHRKEVYR